MRDRKPSVRFSSTAYVLPRTGQRGIPVIATNTRAIAVEIYRLGDRSLVDTLGGENYGRGDFQRSLDRYDVEQLRRLARRRGVEGRARGRAGAAQCRRHHRVSGRSGGRRAQARRLRHGGAAAGAEERRQHYDSLATQWFIVSDLGLTAFSGNDGIHVFVNSLATTEAKNAVEVRLVSRGNEVLATRRTDAAGHAQFEAGLASGEGGSAPALLPSSDGQGDYAFLNLKAPAFDLTDRGVGGRPAPHGLDAFVYAERGVYRSGETGLSHRAVAHAAGRRRADVPLTFVIERPDGVEFRRTLVADQGVGGHSLTLALPASAPTGTWHVRAFTDPKRAAVGETTFLVEDYVPDRIEFDLTSPTGHISQKVPAKVDVAGRFLYGAPAANLDLEGEVTIAARQGAAGFAGYQFGLADEEVEPSSSRSKICRRPTPRAKQVSRSSSTSCRSSTRPLEARIAVRMAEPGGRAVERKITLPVTASGNMIGVKPLFSGRSLADGANAAFDVVTVSPDGAATTQRGLRYELLRIDTHYQFYKRDGSWNYEPVKTTKRVANGTIDTTLDKAGAHFAAGEFRPLPARSLDRRSERAADVGRVRRRLLCRGQCRHAGHARSRARQGRLHAGRHDDGGGDRAQRRAVDAQCRR